MKKLTLFFFIILIAFFSCDGRDRKHKSNVEVLKEKNLLDSFSEQITFIPETYAEVVTDTILSNGFKIKIKTFSDMSDALLIQNLSNSISHKHYHRKLSSQIFIEKDNTVVFDAIINEKFLNNISVSEHINFKDHILNPLEIDQMKSLESDNIVLIASLTSPKENISTTYNIVIDTNGQCKLKRIDHART